MIHVIAPLLLVLLGIWSTPSHADSSTITVGSKNFEESRLLAEMFARVIEEHSELTVKREFNLAGTQVCFEALKNGAIDLYPEYTGTGLVSLLGAPPVGDAHDALITVRREFLDRWDLVWLAPLGFENAYELAVRRELATRDGLRTISDLARVSDTYRAALGYEFIQRDDGLPGLKATYGLEFAEVRGMQQQLKYQAAGAGQVDVLDVYTTDGLILVHDLVVLQDDQDFFPPYAACPLVRGASLRAHPELGNALALLADALSEERMRGYNLRLQQDGDPVEQVAQDALEDLGLVGAREITVISAKNRSLGGYMVANRAQLLRHTGEHIALTLIALFLGVAVAVPLGLALTRWPRGSESILRVAAITQTIPSIALLAFMIPLFGVGALPAVIALWIYSIFPILRNTVTGLRDAGPGAVEAARALGMTERQLLGHIRLPLAVPVILAGVRTAAVITVGTATLAAFIGAGGLGEPIVSGLQMADSTVILSGAIPAALLAVLVDGFLAILERRLTPAGLKETV